jgi:hypothetical protein
VADDLFNKYATTPTAPTSGLAPAPTAGDNLFKKWATPDLSPVIDQALDRNPDEVARQKQMSKQTGVTMDAIAADPQTFEKLFNVESVKKKLADAPITQQLMADANDAAIAQEDVDNLVETEKRWIGGKLGVKRRQVDVQKDDESIPLDIVRTIVGSIPDLAQIPHVIDKAAWELIDQAIGGSDFTKQMISEAENLRATAEGISTTIKGPQKTLSDPVKSGIESGTQALVMMPFGSAATITGMATQSGTKSYETAREEGKTPLQSLIYGTTQGAVEGATEVLPTKHLFKMLRGGNPLWETLGKQLVLENITEQVATAWQDANEWLMLHPEQTFEDYISARPNAALETLISTTVGSVFQTSVSHAVVSSVRDDTGKAKRAEEKFDELNDLQKIYARMRLGQRDPELLIKHQDKVLEKSGVETVYIDSSGFAEYGWKTDAEVGPSTLAKQFGIDPVVVDEAIALGVDIPLTRQQFVRHVMMSQDYADIAPHVRFSPSEMTKAEAEAYKKSGIQEEVQRAMDATLPEKTELYYFTENSKVRDLETGTALKLYHGTDADFENFDLAKAQGQQGDALGKGVIYLTADPDFASNMTYGKRSPDDIADGLDKTYKTGANVRPVYVNIENPYYWKPNDPTGQALVDQAKAAGHDGIIFSSIDKDTNKGFYREVVVFDPNQVKGAIQLAPEAAAVELAEKELGLQGLFTSANEAGLLPKDFEKYLRKVEAARNESVKRQKDKVLKEQLRKADAEWKEEFAKTKAEVQESLGQEQVYQAINNIQRDRLDQKQIRYVFHELVEKGKVTKEDIDAFLEMLPEDTKGRKIYTPTGVAGVDPQVWAEQHGYDSAFQMLQDMMTVPDFNAAVLEKTNAIMDAKYGSLKDARQALIEARESLHNEDKGDLLTFELNALRGAKKGARLKPVLIRQAARDTLSNYFVKEVKPDKFLAAEKREGRKAGMALRKGVYNKALKKWSGADRAAAADAKFRQVLNFFMAKEAYKAARKVEKDVKYLKKFLNRRKKHANLPAESLDVIREILEGYRFGPKLTAAKKRKLQEWATKRNAITGGQLTIPARIAAEESQKFYKDITLDHFNEIVETVRNIEHDGKMEGMFQDAFRKQQVEATVIQIGDNMVKNLKQKKVDRESRLQRESAISAYIEMVSNADTILREMDGWNYGVSYNAIKRPYDRAYSEGYLPGSKGFAARDKAISQELIKLFSVYTRSERASMDDKLLVPGVKTPITHGGILSVLLNSGNSANLKALVEPSKDSGPQFTMTEIKAIHQYASKKDWEFAQSVWDYLDTYWTEIEAAERRRKGYAPEKVEATPIRTPFGTFRGGYYPLRYDGEVTDLESKGDLDRFVEQARFGHFVSSHTRRGHTVERVGSGGKPVKLDLRVLHSHLHQVAYDLEMGDAINDIYKVLYNPKLAAKFAAMGQKPKLDELKLWFGDIVTGELRLNSFGERILRGARTGFTVSKLGFNIANALMQPLGLSNTAAMVGKRNTMWALLQVMGQPHKLRGDNSVFKQIMDKSGFMRLRDDTWHKDINDAIDLLSTTWMAKHSPQWLKDFGRVSTFYFTKKAQKFADTVTWLAGYRKAKLMNKVEKDAVEYADRMVARSQSSGIFGERTRLERGTLSKNIKQTEMVRSFTALASYFLAKTNVAIERTKKLKNPVTNPGQFINYLVDMAMIYTLEGVLATWYMWPDDDEGDGLADDIGWYLAGTTLSSIATGLPGIREVSAAASDYDTGGVIGATAGQAWRAADQIVQAVTDPKEQIDMALFKNVNNMLGIIFHYPSGQMNKTAGAVAKGSSGEETQFWEYVFGVKRD